MKKSDAYGWLFVFACILSAVSVFVPYVKFRNEMAGSVKETYGSLFPSFFAFIALGVCALCVFMSLADITKPLPYIALAFAIYVGRELYFTEVGLQINNTGVAMISRIVSEYTVGEKITQNITYKYQFGFYLLIISVLLMIVFAFLFRINSKEEKM